MASGQGTERPLLEKENEIKEKEKEIKKKEKEIKEIREKIKEIKEKEKETKEIKEIKEKEKEIEEIKKTVKEIKEKEKEKEEDKEKEIKEKEKAIKEIKEKIKEKENEIKDRLFQASMECKWKEVMQLYNMHNFTHEAKLTKSEDTVLHLAISSYHPDRDDSLQHPNPHLDCIQKMVDSIPKEKRLLILKQKNEKRNTPLHLAAELGSVPIMECLVNSSGPELIRETNSKGETPLFITAYRGKLQAFLYLHTCCLNEKGEGPIELCRRGDGDNILHAAISGEYFELAFQIIHHYGRLVNRYNVEGMSPLHYLSRMPQVFKSGSHFRFIDSIIYYCTNVDELNLKKSKAESKVDSYHKRNLPENYQTLVEFLELLRDGTQKVLAYIGTSKLLTHSCRAITEGTVNPDNNSSGHQNDPENPPVPATTEGTVNPDKKSSAEKKRNGKLFPDNYDIFIQFFKFLMKILLVVLGIGFIRIQKLKEKKKQHTWAVQIMNEMIEKEERYKFYKRTGEKPEDMDLHKQIGAPPSTPPPEGETITDQQGKENAQQQPPTSSTDQKMTDDPKQELSENKVTPLLVASKMGIVEMLERILKKFPIAIQDTDSDEKNILLLAVEHRQTNVYNWLIGKKYPDYVFFQVDKQGNNAMHLAAKYQDHELWRIRGAALQLQGERKWYKYVKNTLPPQSYVRYNNKGQTPREIFRVTHAELLKNGTDWLTTTSNSFSVVAALIATVAFAASSTIPGGADDNGHPHLENEPGFQVFAISSLVSLCFSVTALVFFLAILTSRCQHNNFERDLPSKLFLGLTSLFASITSIIVTFCAAHFFVLQDTLRKTAFPIYGVTCIPVLFFAFNQFPLYIDLIRSYVQKMPLRNYKVFYTDSRDESSSNQKKEGKEKDS